MSDLEDRIEQAVAEFYPAWERKPDLARFIASAISRNKIISDEDWQRALDCAMSTLRAPFYISRSSMDNAMQHAFGLLSIAKDSSK